MFNLSKCIFTVVLLLLSIPLLSQQLIPFRDGDKWGYVDIDGNVKIDLEYEEAQLFDFNDLGIVKKNGKYGIIDKTGKVLSKFEYIELEVWFTGQFYGRKKIREEKKCYNSRGTETVCMYVCGTVGRTKKNFFPRKKEGKIGFFTSGVELDSLGNRRLIRENLPAIWEEYIENFNGFAAVRKGDKWGIINLKGELVVEYLYDSIEVSKLDKNNLWFTVGLGGKYGFIDPNCEKKIELKYFKADFFHNNFAKVWIDSNVWFYIDTDGKEYYKK